MPNPEDRWLLVNKHFNLLNVRIVFLSVAFLHLLVTAFVTLSIDTTVDEDPKIKAYDYIRWKLLTCWFNLLTLAYLPARLYVDWRKRRSNGCLDHVRVLDHAMDVLMTGVLFPTTVFADVIFWSIYKTDPALMAPVIIFKSYLPYWSQHSLHSVSLAVVAIDLLLTPRRRPRTMKLRLALLSAFVLAYFSVVGHSLWRGEYVYAFLKSMSPFQLVITSLFTLLAHFVIFYIQWRAIDLLWKKKVYVQNDTIKHK